VTHGFLVQQDRTVPPLHGGFVLSPDTHGDDQQRSGEEPDGEENDRDGYEQSGHTRTAEIQRLLGRPVTR